MIVFYSCKKDVVVFWLGNIDDLQQGLLQIERWMHDETQYLNVFLSLRIIFGRKEF